MVFTNRNYFKFVSPLDRLDDKPGPGLEEEGGRKEWSKYCQITDCLDQSTI